MIKGMTLYYVSRIIITAIFAALLYFTGMLLWQVLLVGGVILALFLWAPHSGRYAIHPEFGITALRRDERSQSINDQAARIAFIVSMLFSGGILVSLGLMGVTSIPIALVMLVPAVGALSYFISDLWFRRSQQ